MRKFLALCAVLVLAGCANSGTGPVPPKTVDKVNLQRYQGAWYELARLPMFIQRDCAQAEAHYRLQDDGSLAVTNRCRNAEGEWLQADGRAEPQEKGETNKLWVRFDNWFSSLAPGLSKGEYWVLYLDKDYRTALVGNPDRDYLWLLSREPQVTPQVREKLLDEAHHRDYDTSKLIWRTPDEQIGKR
ncbi:lipocalin [Pseudomonas cavernae]|uniref:Outer membrane lipoprotein Blc n=1 Tax=Pseudomonas cavernae TaxID=2320867 RepID=A0A385Z5Q4_9PSED|nr:lipocalin family protein [Pseudomonas cavernae]AYC34649.1 lipocalin [Pseudomonas cavernae]